MLKWDGHTHSQFCRHGKGEKTELMVERAIALGFEQYSITEHAPLPPGIIDDPVLAADFTLLPDEVWNYFKHLVEIKKAYAKKITILSGLEIDFIEGYEAYFNDLIKQVLPFLDDLIVSMHMIKGKNGIAPIDYSPESFESELITFYGSAEEVHRAYWRNVGTMVQHPFVSSVSKRIGHLGLINKYIKRFPVPDEHHRERLNLERLFKEIKTHGWDLDYNVAGLKKDLCHDVYISEHMLMLCRQNQIRLIFGSDAHDVESVGQFYHIYLERTGSLARQSEM
jgi:histidinol-phosphatase (PHP family)